MIASLHTNNNFIMSVLTLLAGAGIAMEKNTQVGKAISANLVTMLLALVLANIGIIPFTSPRVINDAGSLLAAFFVGAISTIVGTLAGFALVPLRSLGDEGWKVASALAARHIGGAINFVAVADTLNIDGGIVGAAIAADNVIVALYFAFLFYLATPGKSTSIEPSAAIDTENKLDDEIELPGDKQQSIITASTISYSMATASCLVTVGSMLTKALCPSISSLLFFATSGASGSLVLVLRQAPSLIAFCILQLGIHFGVLVGFGRGLFKMDPNELYLASNANVGGPTTAAAMAQAKDWPRLVLPALLVGVFGYATATAVALSLGPILIKLAAR
eukprot:scaffold248425_cov73-Cyclotella_meneghiniana.AAC.3